MLSYLLLQPTTVLLGWLIKAFHFKNFFSCCDSLQAFEPKIMSVCFRPLELSIYRHDILRDHCYRGGMNWDDCMTEGGIQP